ncbi:hypothetical protein [Methanobacterium alcaliphilum]|uniref:hypothetical protein n=1 Tax=Methanobacterium alcaliphilum TaxID=392018 RepID=UPI00200B3E9A|nr:hypothetical protein [Methanobacterium alcaliphilum]MCK9150977.1 hypothetical protein [Methanobacterium alcaliphilum]
MDINIEQCRENDKIKEIISQSKLPIKYIKLLLRISDTIYLNAINYNVQINDGSVSIFLISSKPENLTGTFNTISLTNVFYKIRDMERENKDMNSTCKIEEDVINIQIQIALN